MPPSGEIRVLCMDDDQGLARLLQKRLQRQGLVVELAADGEAGLAMVEDGYDVLLVDYDMPRCGGLDVLRALTRRPGYPPVIMVTGNGNESVAVDAMRLGAADYVVKDVGLGYLELLPVVIDKVLQKEQLIRERERMLRSVKESEERYRALVELSPNGITIHVDGRFVFANQASADLLGVPAPEALSGKRVLDFVKPDYHELVKERLAQLETARRPIRWIEERLHRLDGSEVTVEIAGVAFVHQGRPAVQVILRDVSERKLAQQRLEFLAHHDALTGLPNRTLFFDRLTHDVAQAKRYGHPMALLYIDLDRFKPINDTLGHDAGDALLKEVANRLVESVRRSDTVARVGGDEFALLLPGCPPERAMVVAERIRALVEAYRLHWEGVAHGVGASIGMVHDDGSFETSDAVIAAADAACYAAKRSGRNRVVQWRRESGLANAA